jgi:hypothetical protein
MFIRTCLSIGLLMAMPSWSQVPITEPATGVGSQLVTPPPVNGEGYSTALGSETRSNYLRTSLTFTTSYSNDVVGEVGVAQVSDVGYSFYPTIALDKKTSRGHLVLNYSPSLTIYQRTSSENQTNQSLGLSFQYRLSPHITFNVRDSLLKSSNIFNQPGQFSGAAASGSPQSPLPEVIGLVADQLSNIAAAEVTYQVSRNGMVGLQGTFISLHFLDPTQVPGLYDSSSSGGSAFYSRRHSKKHYFGGTYDYLRTYAYPPKAISEVRTQTLTLFYTYYVTPTISFSVSGGPQHFEASQAPLPSYASWSPTLTVSTGWQRRYTNFAAYYTRAVSGGGGLVGVYKANSASASARWRLARTWSTGISANYAVNKDETPDSYISTGGGHLITGTVSAQHQLTERWKMDFGYTFLHQSYNGIPVVTKIPNADREYISFTYSFARPLGE